MKVFNIALSIFIVQSFLFVSSVPGQQGSKRLAIGDAVPDIVLSKIINHKSNSIKFSSLRGKVVVLDFWATWCSPCVKGMPKLDTLQRRFGNKLVVLPVTNEKEQLIRHFFKIRKNLALPCVIDSTDKLRDYFPYRSIPHLVLINQQGKIVAITTSAQINEKVIGDVLDGRTIALVEKKDDINYNPYKPLFLDGNAAGLEDKIVFRSLMTKHLPGLSSQFFDTYVNDQPVGFSNVNSHLSQMFMLGSGWMYNLVYSRAFYEFDGVLSPLNDSIIKEEKRTDEWYNRNIFSYDIIAPHLTLPEQLSVMLGEVKKTYAMLGYEALLTKRKVPCLILKVKDSSLVMTKGGQMVNGHNVDTDTLTISNTPLKDLATMMESYCNVPVLDETKLNRNFDLAYKVSDLKDAGPGSGEANQQYFKALLKKIGLYLEPDVREVEVMLLRALKR